MVIFFPEARIKNAYAANAGWYTLPINTEAFPYGLINSPSTVKSLERAFRTSLYILLGTMDTKSNESNLRRTEEAMRQGKNRFERGVNFYDISKSVAEFNNNIYNWKLLQVENVGHDFQKVSAILSDRLLKQNVNPGN